MKYTKLFFLLTFICFTTYISAQNAQQQALAEVGLTEAEQSEIEAIDDQFKQDAKDIRNNTELDRRTKGKQLRALQEERKTQLIEIMGEEKYAQFREIAEQKRKSNKERKDAALSELNLTADQESKIQQINQKFRKAGQELRRDQSVSVEDKKQRAKELRKEQMGEIKSVLSKEQYDKYIEMKKEKRSQK
ncbi:MAG: hypothetical protein AAF849_12665 [Bacteroidota bacterium]